MTKKPSWQPIETAPKGVYILTTHKDWKNPSMSIYMYVLERTIEANCDFNDEDFWVYDEENDTYYCPEGWYEYCGGCSYPEYELEYRGDEPPTHWMPLPELLEE